MKSMIIVISLLMMVGCTQSNIHGKSCVGVFEKKDPALTYELSYWNIFLGVIFSETLIVPAVVVLKDLECPKE